MITIYNQEFKKNKNGEDYVIAELRGLSTDTKPIKIGEKFIENGSQYLEIDTGKIFLFDLESKTWKEI